MIALDYVAGIDGGATKTICIIANTEGKVLGRGVSGSSNYHNVGMSSAKKALLQSIKSASSNAKLGRLRFKVACFGMAGLDSPYDKKIISKFIREEIKFCEKITVVHDSVIALYGATGGAPGLIVEAGTGSFAAGLNKRGEIKRVGGWGNIIGDEGSAYEIGRQALKAFLRSYDGREVKTLLTEKIVKMLKLRVEEDLMQRVYAEKMSISEIAAVAPLVAEAADEGDSVAKRILTEAGRELASYAIAIAKALGMENEDVEVYMTGGVFKAGSHVLKPFEEGIKKIMPKARLASPKFEPAKGAVFLALRELSEKKLFSSFRKH